ncbi:MAG: M20/M25/M40 family metallo-hydrolase [Edaphobacter sp.]
MRLALALLAALLIPASTYAQTPPTVSPETRAAVTKLVGDIMVNGQAYEYDRELADGIGPRLTGSPNYVQAVDWAQKQFRSIGLANIHTESFTMPALWEPDVPATGQIIEPRVQALHIYSAGWSPSTPQDGVLGPVLYLPTLLPIEKLEVSKDTLTGKIVLIDNASFGEHVSIGQLVKAFTLLSSFRPMAVLLTGSANGGQNAGSLTVGGRLASFPVAQIGLEDSSLIRRMLDKGPVTVHFAFKNRIRPATEVSNVIAEIPGREEPSSIVIVGAHLDSWHPATGAQDNGTGVSTVLETARAIQSLNRPPRRTLRFILFGGEEQGLVGSSAYVRKHAADMASIDAVLIADTGAQPSKGWYLMGREDEKQSMTNIEPLLDGLGAGATSTDTDFLYETDHAGFDVQGVPTLVLWNSIDKYLRLHHQASDSFDSVAPADLNQGVAVTAATAYAIADSAQPFAPHLDTAGVQEMLKKARELDNYITLRSLDWVP